MKKIIGILGIIVLNLSACGGSLESDLGETSPVMGGEAGSATSGNAGSGTETAGQAGSKNAGGSNVAGASGSAGKAGIGGNAGQSTAGMGGTAGIDGSAGSAGTAGQSGQAGTNAAGAAGKDGSAGTSMNGGAGGSSGSPQKAPGTLTIEAYEHPLSQIVIGGKDAWVPVAQYKATAKGESVVIDRFRVLQKSVEDKYLLGEDLPSDTADTVAVAIAVGGIIRGQGVFPSGTVGEVDIDASEKPVAVEEDAPVLFQVWAKFANVIPASVVGGPNAKGVALSGHAPAFGLGSSAQNGEWNTSYADKLNVRARGTSSGKELYASPLKAGAGNSVALRKSQPIVTQHQLTAKLSDGEMDLVEFEVGADSAGAIAFKNLNWEINHTGLIFKNFRLLRNDTEIDPNTIDLLPNELSPTIVEPSIAFRDGYEETVLGKGNAYKLRATVSGVVAGSSLTVVWLEQWGPQTTTGYLTYPDFLPGFLQLCRISEGYGESCGAAGFAWSDLSENPHTPNIGSKGGSGDWTHGYLVKDFTFKQTLSNLLRSFPYLILAPDSHMRTGG